VLTLPEEIILLTLENESGKFITVPDHCMRHALAGAVLMELAFLEKIETGPDLLRATDCTPVGDDLLDPALHLLCGSDAPQDPGYWVGRIADISTDIRQTALARLCEKGVLEEKDDLFLWVFRSRRYPTCDGSRDRREVKLRMMTHLFGEDVPDPRDVAIIGLADACRIFEHLLAWPELERARTRIDQVRKLEPVARSVKAVIRDIDRQINQSMSPIG